MTTNRPFFGKKACVIIPCKNREDMFISTFQKWLEQIYEQYQIVVVDYSSDKSLYPFLSRTTQRYQATMDYNVDYSDSKVSLLRVEGQKCFNMSHAINYALQRTSSEAIAIAGTESLPLPYYLETIMMALDNNVFTRCMSGRICCPRKMIEDINGFPELVEFWGGEDDIVVHQLTKNGNFVIDLNPLMVQNLSHYDYHWSAATPYYLSLSRSHNRSQTLEKYDDPEKYGSYVNVSRMEKYLQKHDVNNYGERYGGSNPILINKKDDVDISSITPDDISGINPFYLGPCNLHYGKRCAVIMPVMNRLENMMGSLPQWIDQLYVNKQIIVVDYSSDIPIYNHVKNICKDKKVSISDENVFDYDKDVIVLRLNGLEHFNISHAYNYAISHIKSDIVMTICADSCPRDYYMDICVNLVDDYHIVQCYWGLHCLTRNNWEILNGHQEFIVGWGGEDVDFKTRARMAGLYCRIIPGYLIYHIPQTNEQKGHNRFVNNIARSEVINESRFSSYTATFGHIGNYGLTLGEKTPIGYLHDTSKHLKKLFICKTDNMPNNTPEGVSYSNEYKSYYTITDETLFDWSDICAPEKLFVFLIRDGKTDIDKYLHAFVNMSQLDSGFFDEHE